MIRLFKYWGLDNLLYVVGDESDINSHLEDIEEFDGHIYFLMELKPV